LREGRKVGVVATSHKAINNLLEAIDEAADEEGVAFRGWKKAEGDDAYVSDRVTSGTNRPDDDENGTVRLIAGTAWLWSREAMQDEVDVLFVDEAGQMSLADAIAVAGGARSVVLLGDPQQLAHVSQGTHPLGCGRSVLEHMLGDAQTVPRDRGVFLGTSWRMHPGVCGFVSRAMYDDSLVSVEGCDIQRVDSPGLSGSGLRMIGVEHADNRGRSEEEAQRIADEVAKLLDGGTYVDRDGDTHPLTLDDILVVAPYNAQVRCLRSLLPEGARVGTVDKFQGQEAPVVLFSMASSSGDDVSRGMSFLFSRNRLNVAVSRAQALAVVVCSPKLLGARCATVDDMRLVNMLCRFAGEAGGSGAPGKGATVTS
jgi:superfamily I DNA and/or RNA helicase